MKDEGVRFGPKNANAAGRRGNVADTRGEGTVFQGRFLLGDHPADVDPPADDGSENDQTEAKTKENKLCFHKPREHLVPPFRDAPQKTWRQ